MLNEITESESDSSLSLGEHANEGVEPLENLFAMAVAMGVTVLARRALQESWRRTLKSEPPKNPASHEIQWREALLWGAASGAVVGLARVVSRRASSSAYRAIRSS